MLESEPSLIEKGFEYIDKGIKKYPGRLDMRLGKIHIKGETGDYGTFTNEIVRMISYSATIKNAWTWTDNQPLENAEEFMLTAVQDYQVLLYETGNEALLGNMKRIADTVLAHYPDDFESLMNLVVVSMSENDFDRALELLLSAEKSAPYDYAVLHDIAWIYQLKGNTDAAVRYYQAVMEYGDEEIREYARQQIEELQKK